MIMNYFALKTKLIWIAIFGIFSLTQINAQEITWALTENGDAISSHSDFVGLPFNAGIGLSSFTFGSSGAYAKSWSPYGLDLDDYFELAFYSISTDTFELKSIAFSERRSNTAIRTFQLQYSKQADFSNSILLETYTVPDNDEERERELENVNILILPQDTFYLRWYGYEAESSAGSWRINDNSLKINLIPYVLDLKPPSLIKAEVIDGKNIKMQFDESLDSNSFATQDFTIDAEVHPISIDKSGFKEGLVNLNFINPLLNEQAIHLTYTNIADLQGNKMDQTLAYELFYFYPKAFYVLLNEVMVDPNPAVYLPEVEYIELYNSKNFQLDLNGWSLKVNDKEFMLPECEIEANAYLLLVPEETAILFDTSLAVVEMNFGNLNNSESEISLFSDDKTWIHQLEYTSNWHAESHKKEGGWSLEMIDANDACNMINNWTSSISDQGGTPGKINSVNGINTDRPELEIANAYFDSLKMIIEFNQYLAPSYQPMTNNFSIDEQLATEAIYTDGSRTLSLFFDSKFEADVVYELMIDDEIPTCNGETLERPQTINIGIPILVDSNDIVFNEILFNPLGDHKAYIEFYNRSNHILDLQELKLGVLESDGIYQKDLISKVPRLIFPGDYFVLTKDRQDVLDQYLVKYPERLIETEEIPSLSSSEDILYLMNKGDRIIDQMQYNSGFHNPILKITEGVALERINSESFGMQSASWQSAAQTSGFGTPTDKNSQYSDINQNIKDEISFETESFSPDLDGYHDFLVINYLLEKSGYSASVNIYNSKGQHIVELVTNELTGTEGQWIWDGRDSQDHSSPLGIYVLFFELIHADGSLIQKKKVCTLAGKI